MIEYIVGLCNNTGLLVDIVLWLMIVGLVLGLKEE